MALTGDLLLYLGGKYTGWWLLSGICRFSLNPEECLFSSAETFYRNGPRTLLFAKFIPLFAAVACPLAGSLNMRPARFLQFMAAGEALYCGFWLGLGYAGARYLGQIRSWVESAGHALLIVLLAVGAVYGLSLIYVFVRARRFRTIEKISAASLRERLSAINRNAPDRVVVIADVRSHNYYDPGMQRIKNSIRVEPNRLAAELEALRDLMAPECEIYLYCSCMRDTTSVRVAYALQQANFKTKVIEGGMRAWERAGGEMELVPEGDVRHLPRFD
jgi:rhodanese-related sulfurtransferase